MTKSFIGNHLIAKIAMDDNSNNDVAFMEAELESRGDRTEGFVGLDTQFRVDGVCDVAEHFDSDDVIVEPYVGMEFESEEAAKIFYNEYARRVGFGSRVSRNRRSRKDGTNIARRFVCCKEGYRLKKHENNVNRIKRPRAITREGCEAMILVKKKDHSKWVISKFVKEHNHELLDPVQVLSLRSHRNSSDPMRISSNSFDGMRTGSESVAFGNDNASSFMFSDQDGRSRVQTLRKRKASLEKDSQNVLEYFKRMKSENPSFFYGIQIDEGKNLCSIFWADTRSRMACSYFGDVVYVDTSFKTSRYDMPFAIFYGVNNHLQSTLFGCALLLDDTESSYVWLLRTWLESNLKNYPVLILTDNDIAIEAAIARVFPKTRHAYCRWRILNKLHKHLALIYQADPTFQGEIQKCVEFSISISEFEACWFSLLGKHGLVEDGWLQSIYDVRQKWVPAYLQDAFSAQICTVQRSGNANAFFDACVNFSTTLQEFVTLYEKALDSLHTKELEEDALTMQSKPILKTKLPVEKQAADAFTRAIFSKFQEEIFESLGYVVTKVKEFGTVSTYSVIRFEENKKVDSVVFDSAEKRASCSCHMFEVSGICCRHLLKVFATLNIMTLPSHYILKRWTRDAKNEAVHDEQGVPMQAFYRESVTLRFNNLCKQAIRCVEEGATSVETYDVAARALREAWEKIVNKKAARDSQNHVPSSGSDIISMGVEEECPMTMSNIVSQDPRHWHSWFY